MTRECTKCLRIARVNCVGLCPACDDRMAEAFPEGLVAVPRSVIDELHRQQAAMREQIELTAATIDEMRRDLQAARERMQANAPDDRL